MKALFYPSYGELVVNEQPVPEYNDNEVLLQVSACGICGSELETFAKKSPRRKPPIIMGHEFCGIILEKGAAVEGWAPGTRVVSNSVISCGDCVRCRGGKTNLCAGRKIFGMERNGAFAEFVNVPARCLVEAPSNLSSAAACLAEPLANGVHMVELTRHIPLKRILVIGAGPIGLMAQQAFQVLRGASVIVADLKEGRLETARKLGAEHVFNSGKGSLEDEIMSLTSGEGVDLVIDAVGMAITNRQALNVVGTGGAVILIGLHENSSSLYSYDIILSEKKVMGSYAANLDDISSALQLMADQKVDVTSWVNYYSLQDGEKAFRNMMLAEGTHIKSVLLIHKDI
ncbi:MAG: alcohol dehydrogenase catalytic domain-containing protein [Ginsengibacter sp.]